MSTYKIRSVEERDDEDVRLFWSNTEGWVPYEDSDTFTEMEHWLLPLPIGGYWYATDR